jgi:hypothetical protein
MHSPSDGAREADPRLGEAARFMSAQVWPKKGGDATRAGRQPRAMRGRTVPDQMESRHREALKFNQSWSMSKPKKSSNFSVTCPGVLSESEGIRKYSRSLFYRIFLTRLKML